MAAGQQGNAALGDAAARRLLRQMKEPRAQSMIMKLHGKYSVKHLQNIKQN